MPRGERSRSGLRLIDACNDASKCCVGVPTAARFGGV